MFLLNGKPPDKKLSKQLNSPKENIKYYITTIFQRHVILSGSGKDKTIIICWCYALERQCHEYSLHYFNAGPELNNNFFFCLYKLHFTSGICTPDMYFKFDKANKAIQEPYKQIKYICCELFKQYTNCRTIHCPPLPPPKKNPFLVFQFRRHLVFIRLTYFWIVIFTAFVRLLQPKYWERRLYRIVCNSRLRYAVVGMLWRKKIVTLSEVN